MDSEKRLVPSTPLCSALREVLVLECAWRYVEWYFKRTRGGMGVDVEEILAGINPPALRTLSEEKCSATSQVQARAKVVRV